jgi:flagellar motor switch protein FliM
VADILKLNSGPDDLITLNIGSVPKFTGFPGVAKGNRAVEITALLSPKGDHQENGRSE